MHCTHWNKLQNYLCVRYRSRAFAWHLSGFNSAWLMFVCSVSALDTSYAWCTGKCSNGIKDVEKLSQFPSISLFTLKWNHFLSNVYSNFDNFLFKLFKLNIKRNTNPWAHIRTAENLIITASFKQKEMISYQEKTSNYLQFRFASFLLRFFSGWKFFKKFWINIE